MLNMQRTLGSERCSYDFAISIDLCFICSWTIFGQYKNLLFIRLFFPQQYVILGMSAGLQKGPEEKVHTMRRQ